VVSYDPGRGLGLVAEGVFGPGDAAPCRTYRFHCTAIADGSRRIDEGAGVVFVLVPSLGGELEGRYVTALVAAPQE